MCSQRNGVGSKCTTVISSGACKIAICGGYLRNESCENIAEVAKGIISECTSDGSTGGSKSRNDDNLSVSVSKN